MAKSKDSYPKDPVRRALTDEFDRVSDGKACHHPKSSLVYDHEAGQLPSMAAWPPSVAPSVGALSVAPSVSAEPLEASLHFVF